jgi:hypothetical protein
MEWTHSRFTSALIPACFAGFEAASQSTKRAELGGDSESFTLKRRRRASLSKSADEGTQAGEEPRFGSMGIFANKWRSVVNQKAQRISKSELSASPNGFRAKDLLVNGQVFERLCLRVFSAFCDLRLLSALGTGGACECRT